MITFVDGPAAGETLETAAAPFYLRVVRSKKGEWDVLDQPSDKPKKGEEIFVYVLTGEPFRGMIDWHDGRGRQGRPFVNAEYRLYPVQPEDDIVRTTAGWDAWRALQPIGKGRAEKLEQHMKAVIGMPNPLHFCNSYFHWGVIGLEQLTEVQGKELIDVGRQKMAEARVQMAQEAERDRLRAEQTQIGLEPPHGADKHVRYDIAGRTFKRCRACNAEITFVKTENNQTLPVTRSGYSHYLDCTEPKRFSKSNKAASKRQPGGDTHETQGA